MKIQLLVVGDTNIPFVEEGEDLYLNRLKHYINFEKIVINRNKAKISGKPEVILKFESEAIKEKIKGADYIVLFDKKGTEYCSNGFARFLQERINSGIRKIIFIIGGAYGFNKDIYELSNKTISLSKMTFPHQVVRLIIIEQFYRAFTILKGESYHNE